MKRSVLLTFGAAALLSLAACNKDAARSDVAGVPEGSPLRLVVGVEGSMGTRATGITSNDESTEAKVNSLQVLVFNGDNLDGYGSSVGSKIATVSCTSGSRDIYAVVNAPSLASITTKTALLATVSELANEVSNFQMIGHKTETLQVDGNVEIGVDRLAARVVERHVEEAVVVEQHRVRARPERAAARGGVVEAELDRVALLRERLALRAAQRALVDEPRHGRLRIRGNFGRGEPLEHRLAARNDPFLAEGGDKLPGGHRRGVRALRRAEGPRTVCLVCSEMRGFVGIAEGVGSFRGHRHLTRIEEAARQVDVWRGGIESEEAAAIRRVGSEEPAVEKAVGEPDVHAAPVGVADEAAGGGVRAAGRFDREGYAASLDDRIPAARLRPPDEAARAVAAGPERARDVQVVDGAAVREAERRGIAGGAVPVERERMAGAVEAAGIGVGVRSNGWRGVVERDVGGHQDLDRRLAVVHEVRQGRPVRGALDADDLGGGAGARERDHQRSDE
ncbi:MAG: hypothetical protein IJ678_07070 [Kiritimatiellae bacterium]|nr:hypothetical protein [Kiritimatiellia bacterium]